MLEAVAVRDQNFIVVCRVHRTPWEHVRARHERRPIVSADHEHLGSTVGVSQNEHSRGGPNFSDHEVTLA
jgi:hypothetical protein